MNAMTRDRAPINRAMKTPVSLNRQRRLPRQRTGLRRLAKASYQGTLPLALSARIPPEVFELVVDAITYQPTLAAVALVCALWYPRAMHNLYYNPEIRGHTSSNMLFQ